MEADGTLGVTWLAVDDRTSVLWVVGSALFHKEVMAVVADGITSRGQWIPMAWSSKDQEWADKLLDLKVNVLPEGSSSDQAAAEIGSRELLQIMRGDRFRIADTAHQWKRESKDFYANDKIPLEGFPLMSATRYALEQMSYARPQTYARSTKRNHPNIKVF